MPLTMGHEFSGTITAVGDGCHRLGRRRPGRGRTDLQVRSLRAVPGGQLQRLPADRLPRPDVRRRDGRIHRRADQHAAPAARQRLAGTRRARRADVGGLPRRDARRCPPPAIPRWSSAPGPIGIGLWFALRGKGLDDVFVVEPSATRRAAIEALGATTLDPTAIDVPAFIADHTEGDGADAVSTPRA